MSASNLNHTASATSPLLQKIGGYAGTGAEISAFDPDTQRLFVVSGGAEIEVLDLSDPTNPSLLQVLDLSPYGAAANSVAIQNGLVAVAVESDPKTDPGRAVFLDTDGNFLAALVAGALPDMITFSPDGTKVLVANEGEPNDDYTIDPEGSVTIIDLANGLENVVVKRADFRAFNDQKADLQGKGVRIFGPNATVAQDFEPEYITVSEDGKTAWVALQENNALAVLDLETGTFTDILPLGLKDFSKGQPTLTVYDWDDRPVLGATATVNPADPTQTVEGQEILLGGFSGLFFEGKTEDGKLRFITHSDRGPNGEPTDVVEEIPGRERPFALPDFQPELIRFELDQTTGEISITERIGLTRTDGTPLTGLPNLQAGEQGTAFTDEVPVDLFGNVLPNDPFGADFEGIVVAPDGTFWLVDEYRPAIYHFDTDGTLIDRFIPAGEPTGDGSFGTPTLPEVYAQRRNNRGFEAVALEGNKLYAFIQSAIDNPDSPEDTTSRGSRNLRILEFDIETKAVTGEYLYLLNDISGSGTARTDKIGDAVALGNGKFLVAERDDREGFDSNKLIYEIDLAGATNVKDVDTGEQTLEQLSVAELSELGLNPVDKRLVVNAAAIGYTGVDKLEGLALIDENTIAILNDNDFGLLGEQIAGDGTLTANPDPTPVRLGIIAFDRSNGLDLSDRDGADGEGAINIQNHPVFGLYQPDAIDSFTVNGETFIITANEGDARDYDGFAEEVRVGDEEYVLDPAVFPNAEALRDNAVLGRLTVTNATGDTTGDGQFNRIEMFGGRSFSIWDANGNLVYDSGDDFERITAAQVPEIFNSNGTPETFDTRSDNKGPEPESVVVGEVGDRLYAFIGLERTGGVMVYDVTQPRSPHFVEYFPNDADDQSPEGLIFIPAADSPNGQPLLVISNEVSGTIAILEINPNRDELLGTDTPIAMDDADDLLNGTGAAIEPILAEVGAVSSNSSNSGLPVEPLVVGLGSGSTFEDLTNQGTGLNQPPLLSVANQSI
ncbi:calcium-binding protein [filamentous cyanobacterium CCP2]|nr:calcium-binding protein [filamentous cyanobacterium CCP2]